MADPPPYVWLVFEPDPTMAPVPVPTTGSSPKGSATKGAAAQPGRWLPLCQADNARLEVGLSKGAELVPVEMGRYDVRVAERKMRSVYWEEPEKTVIRSLWFKQPPEGAMIPFDEEDSANLEKALQRLRARTAAAPLLVPVEKGQHDVRFELLPKEESWFWSNESEQPQYSVVQESVERENQKDPTPVWRWYYAGKDAVDAAGEEESLLPERVECLFIIVHGIGQAYKWDGDGGRPQFHREVTKVRKNAVKRLLERIRTTEPVPGRLEFLPMQWYDVVHEEAGIGDQLKAI